MGTTTPRKAKAFITYTPKGSKSTRTASMMEDYSEHFTYEDPASGQSDTMSIRLCNRDLKWAGSWAPVKGDKIRAKIKVYSWDAAGKDAVFDCGKFCCDDIAYAGPGLTCTISGNSVPESQSFRSRERSRTWKKVTLKEIASKIADKYGFTLQYDADTIQIGSIEQSGETDSSFLNGLCEDYGIYLKVFYGSLILYDIGKYEDKKAVATIDLSDLEDWSYHSTLTSTYTGATLSYTSGSDDKELSVTVGKEGRILKLTEKADSKADALLRACAKVNEENRKAVSVTATILPNIKIVAGVCVKITGLKNLNGKYFVDKVTHTIDGESGYTMSLELHLVQSRIKAAGTKKSSSTSEDTEEETKTKAYQVGDVVTFNGGSHYVSSTAGTPSGGTRKAGKAKITYTAAGAKHPWHLVGGAYNSLGGTCNVYGWVDDGTFT